MVRPNRTVTFEHPSIVGAKLWLVNHEVDSEIVSTGHSSAAKAKLKVRNLARKHGYVIDKENLLRAKTRFGIVVYATILIIE